MPNPRQLDPFSRAVLEFPSVVALLRGFLSSPIAEPWLVSLEPRTRLETIRAQLECAAEASHYLRSSARPRLDSVKDPRPVIEKLRVEGAVLSAFEIMELLQLASLARDFRSLFADGRSPRLAGLAGQLPDFRQLLQELNGKILPDGSVDSSASPALARIRGNIERARQQLQRRLEAILDRLSRGHVLQDAVVTLRNERFVLPIRVEEKHRVPGVVHGASSSGATVYIEPLETVPLNNDLVELQEAEAAEIQRILAAFGEQLRSRREELSVATEVLSEIDLAFAKAEFAREYACCIPEFVSGRTLTLKGGRHPLLERALRGRGRGPVPLSLELSEPKTLMVISGPNAGGKTVALKTLGIAVLMAQAGLPVPAEEARLPLFERVLADIGDQQSIQADLSTFSAHIGNIRSMMEVAGRNDLILLDEIGSSTEPGEGAALGLAILERFRERGAITLVSTHHARLKAYAAETPQAVNAAMEFDEATLAPTYRLLVGLPGKSSALEIAARLGLDRETVEKARALLHAVDAEAAGLIRKLHEQRAELERKLAELEAARQQLAARAASLERRFEHERRAKLEELDARLEETLRRVDGKLEAAIAGLQGRSSADVQKKVGRRAATVKSQAREEWNAQVLEALGAARAEGEAVVEKRPAVGDRVRLPNLSTPGTIIALVGDDEFEVEVGRVRMRVRADEVRVIGTGKGPTAGPLATVSPPSDVPEELNVIGNTADEARQRVDKFLDEAYLAGRFRVRIVHGHGKGVLRKTLHEMLALHPHVEKFSSAPPSEGGTGATIVELKM